ncbi:hypothetical protein [Chryseolinea sp. H1M3-3]|uniref:hypothetical protein n=1 Tax=Chryseolinea sp. H1M3-3 TaxID=3034144 RepID=UPI0023EDBB06|nr:hypothetical protein [Chryseolinea sp. H1M3-3]
MKQVWILLTGFCFLTIVALLFLTIDIEIVVIKWAILILFIIGLVRLAYYDSKLTFLRSTTILILLGVLYYWRSDLDLSRNWTPRITVYENKQIRIRTIELQTRGTGEWPEQRMIDRFSIIPCVYWKKEIDKATITKMDTLTWRKVNRKIERSGSAQQPL